MPYIGRIEVPEIAPAEVFPVKPEYGSGRALKPEVYVHTFKSGNVKLEQRFLMGTGATRFHVVASLSPARRVAMREFWEKIKGACGAFFFDAANDDCQGTTRYVCRFEDPSLTYEYVTTAISTIGVNLVEIPQDSPTYPLNATET
ncbi:MAG: hypothetical protein FJW34_27200, partial [Acidobacteria bacterium]|nr:hypothetical protein [Acidobacteriota bacterium]